MFDLNDLFFIKNNYYNFNFAKKLYLKYHYN